MKLYSLLFFVFIISFQTIKAQQQPDQLPVFPGCEQVKEKMPCFKEKVLEHISANFNTDLLHQVKDARQVNMFVQFEISPEGKLQNFEITSPYDTLNQEMKKVLQSLPKVQPAQSGGNAISMQYQLPIVFEIKQ